MFTLYYSVTSMYFDGPEGGFYLKHSSKSKIYESISQSRLQWGDSGPRAISLTPLL